MAERSQWRFPWGVAMAAALLAFVLVGALRVFPIHGETVSWYGVGADFVVALSAFLVLRALVSWLAGMSAALLIALSSPFVYAARLETPVLAQGLAMFTLAFALGGWKWLERPTSTLAAVLGWLVIGTGSLVTLTFAWMLQPGMGLAASLLVMVGFIGAGVSVIRRLRAGLSGSRWSVAAALTIGVLAPAASLFTGAALAAQVWEEPAKGDAAALLTEAAEVRPIDVYEAIIAAQKSRPFFLWLTMGFTLWGMWRALRGGLILSRSQKLPTPWLLLLFTLLHLLSLPQSPGQTNYLSLVACAILLSVFGIGDFFRRIGQSLILRPPHERADMAE